MIRRTVHEGWQLTAVAGPVPGEIAGRTVPARVPGSAHLDLLAAGLVPDPYLDRNEEALAWAHRAEWRYTTTLAAEPAAPDERVDLAFDGLDTVATVELGGHLLGRVANMHRSHRFDVRALLGADGDGGPLELAVTFHSALAHAEAVERELGRRPHAYQHPFNMVRKMACSFGWDWGPDLQTAGIHRPVRLERWHTARLARVRPLVTVDPDGTGRVEVHAEVERAGLGEETDLALAVTVAGHQAHTHLPAGSTTALVDLAVPGVRLWWPAGHGDQPLYELRVELTTRATASPLAPRPAPLDAEPLDSLTRRVGFRTVTVDTTPDDVGTPFTLVVNGTPIFAKGANWIPDDHFLTRVTRERVERRVAQALGAHMNMLRVWGGGIYETDAFYDVCDERGVLVWQDFALACAAYPEEEPLWSEIEAEARENVSRLASHPSLALWNGGNENLWGHQDWGWREELGDRSWGGRYATELLPAVVAELDPTRPYTDNSPQTPRSTAPDGHPNDAHHGTRHEWDVWNRRDYTTYRDHVPRFCSEFGFQGPPTWTTLTTWIHDDPLTTASPGFLLHQKAVDGQDKLDRGMAGHLPPPATFADWHWATQLNQARAVAFGVEHFRSHWPTTAGALVWQLNDCWPVTSWAAVDSEERPKPLWYALRHAFAPRLLTVQPREGRPTLLAVNDTGVPWRGRLRCRRVTFTGETLASATLSLDVPTRAVAALELPAPLVDPADPGGELLVADAGAARVVHLFAEDPDLAYDPAPLDASAVAVPGGYRVEVRAASFARDVALLADRAAPDAVVDDMLVPLLAGERRSFTVLTSASLDPTSLTAPPVLRSANSLAAGDR
ncbi:glycoside hydrolase family 2 protein [Streptomyces sp. 4N509B]|uniref:glycoside hydrolase family 2 protein n=1 Tax=Streptomyces sp. 4N509B TaxID=3457413 RepID=UPI003FD640DE